MLFGAIFYFGLFPCLSMSFGNHSAWIWECLCDKSWTGKYFGRRPSQHHIPSPPLPCRNPHQNAYPKLNSLTDKLRHGPNSSLLDFPANWIPANILRMASIIKDKENLFFTEDISRSTPSVSQQYNGPEAEWMRTASPMQAERRYPNLMSHTFYLNFEMGKRPFCLHKNYFSPSKSWGNTSIFA